MFIQIIALVIVLAIIFALAFYTKVKQNIRDPQYFQITFLLGSGGHTGQICKLFKGFRFRKTSRINILITETDKSSLNFFTNSLKSSFGEDYNDLEPKLCIHYVKRTNQVKQSYITTIFSASKALLNSILLILTALRSTTHFISNGPGTCVPFFYVFFLLKTLKLSRVKLVFIESWCRVRDLSLSGKLVKPIVDQFIVHWPELAKKFSKCKYYGQII